MSDLQRILRSEAKIGDLLLSLRDHIEALCDIEADGSGLWSYKGLVPSTVRYDALCEIESNIEALRCAWENCAGCLSRDQIGAN